MKLDFLCGGGLSRRRVHALAAAAAPNEQNSDHTDQNR
jgi:hypothetical protein